MSKKFRIAKRISMEDIDHFEDVEVDDDFVDNEMVQIIADNEYDPMYDDCESIAVALQLAGYGNVADLEAKLGDMEQEQIKEMQEHQEAMKLADNTITNLVEDNRASQEWYKKQLAESEKKFIIANNLRKKSDEVLLNYKTEKYGLEKTIQELRKMKLNLPEKEWYYKGFENCERQTSSHIADLTLEVKELKQQLEDTEEQNKRVLEKLELIVSANQELEQKLAEKEKEIEKLKSENHALMSENAYQEADIFELTQKLSIHNQDKISFAVEQLEKVKEFFLEEHRDEEMDTDYIITKDAGQIADYLLDQIQQLKERK